MPAVVVMAKGEGMGALAVYWKVASPPKVFFTMLIEPVCALVNVQVTLGKPSSD